jgi:hypothetical protein
LHLWCRARLLLCNFYLDHVIDRHPLLLLLLPLILTLSLLLLLELGLIMVLRCPLLLLLLRLRLRLQVWLLLGLDSIGGGQGHLMALLYAFIT